MIIRYSPFIFSNNKGFTNALISFDSECWDIESEYMQSKKEGAKMSITFDIKKDEEGEDFSILKKRKSKGLSSYYSSRIITDIVVELNSLQVYLISEPKHDESITEAMLKLGLGTETFIYGKDNTRQNGDKVLEYTPVTFTPLSVWR
jgi:hypothetical protein